jgi:hypothetical protein
MMALRLRVAMLLILLLLPASLAQAQGLPQRPFGYGPPPRAYHYPGMSPYRMLPPYGGPLSPYQPYGDDQRPLARGGTYRTLCVRLCDGFYFPISGAATQDSLARDADACSASCGAEARLFYHPNDGGDVDTMVDLTGIAYSALPTAFKYRKTLVEGCRCRPHPWSEAELERHRAYGQGRMDGIAPRNAEIFAGGDRTGPSTGPVSIEGGDFLPAPRVEGLEQSDMPTPDDAGLVARPPPVVRPYPY